MAKHTYSEIKHPDKFAEALSAAWEKAEPYALPVCLAAIGILALTALGIALSRHYGARAARPWDEHFEIARELAADTDEDAEARSERAFSKMADLVSEYRGRPVAAFTLLELAQGHSRRAEAEREENPQAAKEYLEKAADAAEQFVADFPGHRHVALAYYEAGKARLDLGEHERAAQHFAQAAESRIGYLAVLAKWHRAFCYEKLGRTEEARTIYRNLRDDPAAGWVAEQAEFQLTRLRRAPAKSG